MVPTDLTIKLNFDPLYFKEIYFRNDHGRILFHPMVKSPFIFFLVALILFLSSLTYSYMTNEGIFVTVLIFLMLFYASLNLYANASAVLKWRKGLFAYLDKISKVKEHRVILSDNTLTMIEDGVETVVKWSVFSKLVIEENTLAVWGGEDFIFPRKSMSDEEFRSLTEIARSRIKSSV